MTPEEILHELDESNSTKVKLAITDIDGILRGKVISIEKIQGYSRRDTLGFAM